MNVIIVGAGIGGLTLALELHDAGIPCQVYDAVPEFHPVGVGINILPHATGVLDRHGLIEPLAQAGIRTRESVFFNRFGQLIHEEPAGLWANYATPQISIHRGDIHSILLSAVRERLGSDAVVLGQRCTGVTQDERKAVAHFRSDPGDEKLTRGAAVVVACDGIHSVLRKQLHPDEGEPVYSGINMWRGVTTWQPFLTGASMVRAGWMSHGKLVIYPIRDDVDGSGAQLVNWVAELETPRHMSRAWNRRGRLDDFSGAFADWHFDWMDVPAFIQASESVLEYPMVDQDPLPDWGVGRVTLLGDAAHPMVPRGSNGAGQAILDARALREALTRHTDPTLALRAYESERLPATSRVVLANRTSPPDVLLKLVAERTGDRPFHRIEDVISADEIASLSQGYKQAAGLAVEDL